MRTKRRDDLYISLDMMKSPVRLCTGVTYDHASIQRWPNDSNNTCPATMQVLHTKDLIQIWSDSATDCRCNAFTATALYALSPP
ncbi:U-box domain-containing protein 27 [Turnera subulata]|uniref:U-box domain-containing protein n=1 Tax=Turnera subulata TaxID=218843 RepID=A0A9Q0JGK0_9ROSI|nr:U-box domain-containing protein 27 [Turnera subulata]